MGKIIKKSRKLKKAMSMEDMGMLLYRIIFIAASVYVFVLFANMLLSPFPDIYEPRAEILMGRVLYSDTIHYKNDPINRIYNNIIDLDKLNSFVSQDDLEVYFRNEIYHPSRTNLLVFNLTTTYWNETKFERKSFVSNQTQFKLLNPKIRFKGKGAVTGLLRIFESSCKLNSTIIPCNVQLKVLIPNS